MAPDASPCRDVSDPALEGGRSFWGGKPVKPYPPQHFELRTIWPAAAQRRYPRWDSNPQPLPRTKRVLCPFELRGCTSPAVAGHILLLQEAHLTGFSWPDKTPKYEGAQPDAPSDRKKDLRSGLEARPSPEVPGLIFSNAGRSPESRGVRQVISQRNWAIVPICDNSGHR